MLGDWFIVASDGGCGLDLAIRRAMVEAHSGPTSVEPQVGGSGLFSFTSPRLHHISSVRAAASVAGGSWGSAARC